MKAVARLFAFTLLGLPALAQHGDISIVAGGGVSVAEDDERLSVAAVGASIGVPYSSRHRFQFDYLLNSPHGGNGFVIPANRHFLTASYVVQGRTGRTRSFFQLGAGIVYRPKEGFRQPETNQVLYLGQSQTSFAAVLGGGATIDLGKSLFLRPQLRLYADAGLAATILPNIGLGWRF
jgi:hypothetical protein